MGDAYQNYGSVTRSGIARDTHATTAITNYRIQVNNYLLNNGTSGTVNRVGDEKSFKCYHNTYLSASSEGKVKLMLHCHSYEKWHMIHRDNNKCYLKSVHGTFLRGTPDGYVNAVANCEEWEEWTLVPLRGKIGLRSCHGTFLRANDDETVNLATECNTWELWII